MGKWTGNPCIFCLHDKLGTCDESFKQSGICTAWENWKIKVKRWIKEHKQTQQNLKGN